jgi:hypothetical protein
MVVETFQPGWDMTTDLKEKYLSSKTLGQVEVKPGDSPFWQGLMEVKKKIWPWCRIVIRNGEIHGYGSIIGSKISLSL